MFQHYCLTWNTNKNGRGGSIPPRPCLMPAYLDQIFFFHFVPCGVSSRMMPFADSSSRMASLLAQSFALRAALRSAMRASICAASPPSSFFLSCSMPKTPMTSSMSMKNFSAAATATGATATFSLRYLLTSETASKITPMAAAVLKSSSMASMNLARNSSTDFTSASPAASSAPSRLALAN